MVKELASKLLKPIMSYITMICIILHYTLFHVNTSRYNGINHVFTSCKISVHLSRKQNIHILSLTQLFTCCDRFPGILSYELLLDHYP